MKNIRGERNNKNNNRIDDIPKSISSINLLKFRLWFYGINLCFVLYTAWQLINIDYRKHDDDRLLFHEQVRFVYYTIWNYKLHLVYLPLAMFCDYFDLRRKKRTATLEIIQQFRNFFATSIMSVVTLYVDLVFWTFWLYDRELIVPSYCDAIVSYFNQHCLHTLTLTTVLVDLATVPRSKPIDDKWARIVATILGTACMAAITWAYYETGQWIYPYLGLIGFTGRTIFYVLSVFVKMLIYDAQWKYVNLFWSNSKPTMKKIK